MMVHVLWYECSDKDYEVGPFYFCSNECREWWKQATIKTRDLREANHEIVSTVIGFRDNVEDKSDDQGCDWCRLKDIYRNSVGAP